MKGEKKTAKPVGFWLSVLTFLVLIVLVVSMTAGLKTAPHVPLLMAAAFAAVVGAFHRFSWKEMMEGMTGAISTALPALLIIMSIGILIAAWMAGGVIPTMVYYGLQIISPRFFLVTALLLCSLVSLAIGSSLSTIGTVGVALFGIGSALGIPPAITAGAIVSGAYFGDKMSPLSDTTNLAPSVSDANVFDHIRHMMVTTTPTYLICIVIYGIIGFAYGGGTADTAQIEATLRTLREKGLDGLECFYPRHTPGQTAAYLRLAEKYGLHITAGSDFHGEAVRPDTRLTPISLELGWLI